MSDIDWFSVFMFSLLIGFIVFVVVVMITSSVQWGTYTNFCKWNRYDDYKSDKSFEDLTTEYFSSGSLFVHCQKEILNPDNVTYTKKIDTLRYR